MNIETIRYIGLKFSDITEIVKLFYLSEILFSLASSHNNKHMLMRQKNVNKDSPI